MPPVNEPTPIPPQEPQRSFSPSSKKWLWGIASIFVVSIALIAAFFAFNSYIYEQKQAPEENTPGPSSDTGQSAGGQTTSTSTDTYKQKQALEENTPEALLSRNQSEGWQTTSTDLRVTYPPYLKPASAENKPVTHLIFEESGQGLYRVFVSAAALASEDDSLKNWLETNSYFKWKYHNHVYAAYKRSDGVEVIASFDNADSYDEAFIKDGAVIVYFKNGVNGHTKMPSEDFRELIARSALPAGFVIDSNSTACLSDSDELMSLYLGKKYQNTHPSVPFMYDEGPYCELKDGSKLITFAYWENDKDIQALALFDQTSNLTRSYANRICSSIGDFVAPRILSTTDDTATLYCLSGDAGEIAFSAYQAPLSTLVPAPIERDSALYNQVKSVIKERYNLDWWK